MKYVYIVQREQTGEILGVFESMDSADQFVEALYITGPKKDEFGRCHFDWGRFRIEK